MGTDLPAPFPDAVSDGPRCPVHSEPDSDTDDLGNFDFQVVVLRGERPDVSAIDAGVVSGTRFELEFCDLGIVSGRLFLRRISMARPLAEGNASQDPLVLVLDHADFESDSVHGLPDVH